MLPDPRDLDTIEDVVQALDTAIELGLQSDARWTVFAALYRRMTRAVQRAINEGVFDDGPRMSWFDAVFARRYLSALRAFLTGDSVPRCWALALRGSAEPNLLAMQHLLLGVNAHINLDLGFSVVEAELELPSFRSDFDRINDILAAELDGVQDAVDEVSPWFAGLDRWMGTADERLGVFVLVRARAQAWSVAEAASRRRLDERAKFESEVDGMASALGHRIARPGFPWWLLVALVRWRESWTVPDLVAQLSDRSS